MSQQEQPKWQCQKCLVNYRIAPRDPRCDSFRCSTEGCGKSFWTGSKIVGKNMVATMNMETRPE